MTLNAQTKIGLTFGQIVAIIVVVFGFAMGYANLEQRIAATEQKQYYLQNTIALNQRNAETYRIENRDDHKIMFQKIDQILIGVSKIK